MSSCKSFFTFNTQQSRGGGDTACSVGSSAGVVAPVARSNLSNVEVGESGSRNLNPILKPMVQWRRVSLGLTSQFHWLS